MENNELIKALKNAYQNQGQDALASLIVEHSPLSPDVYDVAITSFNLSKENVEKNRKAADFLMASSDSASQFSTIVRVSTLAETLKKIDNPDSGNKSPSIQFGRTQV